MKNRTSILVFAIASFAASLAEADGNWMDGKVTYKFAGVDKAIDTPAEACKAGVA